MIQKALDWGRKTNNLRVNPIHGEEEIRMVLSETFCHKEVHQEETNREGGMVVQDRFVSLGILLQCYTPLYHMNPYAILNIVYIINHWYYMPGTISSLHLPPGRVWQLDGLGLA